jgi:cell division protein FtsL
MSPVYRIFRRGTGEAAALRPVIVAMVALALALAIIGSIRVSNQHDVLRYGYELSRRAEQVRALRETSSRLELEHSMLAAPDRIRKLATQLGMTMVAPDRIRVVHARSGVAQR